MSAPARSAELRLTGIVASTRLRECLARERAYRRLLASADALAALLALLVVFGLPGAGQTRWAFLLIAPAIVLAAKLLGLYDRDELVLNKTTLDDAPRVISIGMTVVIASLLLSDHLLAGSPSRGADIAFGLILVASMMFGRYSARLLAARLTPPERCLVIGGSHAVTRMSRLLAATPHAELVSWMSLCEAHALLGEDVSPLAAERLLAENDVHRVIIEPESVEHGDVALDVVRGARAHGVRISLLPSVLDVAGTAIVPDEIGGLTLLGVAPFGLSRSSQIVKRGFDIVVSVLTLLLTAPLLALAAVAIRLETPGPIVFSQPRIGRGGELFSILKLRTMVRDAEELKAGLTADDADGLFKLPDDPRVTRVGRVLRRTSFDELPQLLNVLRGQMSLVGPRPLIPREDRQVKGWDRQRLSITPGMTGPWQIAGPTRAPLAEMVKLDYRYVASWSLWRDIEILLRTIRHVVLRHGS